MKIWETFAPRYDLHYPETSPHIFTCSVDILAWKKREDYEQNHEKCDVVATVTGEVRYGKCHTSIVFHERDAKQFLFVKKAIHEAKEIISIELDYAVSELYS
jgi:hypothetical protein